MKKYVKRPKGLQAFQQGKIKFFNGEKNYGFIVTEDGVDLFFHRTRLVDVRYVSGTYDYTFGPSPAKPKSGQKVFFIRSGEEANCICDVVQLLFADRFLRRAIDALVPYKIVLITWEIKYRADNANKRWLPEKDSVRTHTIFEGDDVKAMWDVVDNIRVDCGEIEYFVMEDEKWVACQQPLRSQPMTSNKVLQLV